MVKLFVEGGGNAKDLRNECREGFRAFIASAGITQKPRIFACGTRSEAFKDYCTAIANGEKAFLLVDSEAPVSEALSAQNDSTQWKPWLHLKNREADRWDKPAKALDVECHLMVECMENWFLADRKTLKEFFGQEFQEKQLPAPQNSIEKIPKKDVFGSLAKATKNCKTKGMYGKGAHSFKLLKEINPDLVINASPWAKRFIEQLRTFLDAR